MSLRPLPLLLAILASCQAAPAGTFTSFNTKALYSDYSYDSGASFFDSDLFSSDYDFPTDFPSNFQADSGLGGDTGFSINGICDSFCQEAESEVNQFEQNVRDFEAKFGGNSGSTFPAVAGGSFPVSGVVPTSRPHARPRNTPFTVRPTLPNAFSARPRAEPTPFTAFPRPTRFPVTRQPTARQTARPAARPTARPTARPNARPSAKPTARPTATKTDKPTARPKPPPPRAPARPTTTRSPSTTTDRAFRLSPTLRSTPELPKAASLPEVTTSSPVVWSFKGETLGGGVQPGRAGRTQATESPDSATDGSLPIDSFFSSGDSLVDPAGAGGDGTGFPVFDAVPK